MVWTISLDEKKLQQRCKGRKRITLTCAHVQLCVLCSVEVLSNRYQFGYKQVYSFVNSWYT